MAQVSAESVEFPHQKRVALAERLQAGRQLPAVILLASARNILADCTPPADVAKDLGVSVPTLYRWVPARQQ